MERYRDKHEQTFRANVSQVAIKADTVAGFREAIGRLFYIDGTKPTEAEIKACLDRFDELPPEVAASRCHAVQ